MRSLLEEVPEEALGEILRIGRGVSAMPHEGVDRIPVHLAQLGEGVVALVAIRSLGIDHESPARGGKLAPHRGAR